MLPTRRRAVSVRVIARSPDTIVGFGETPARSLVEVLRDLFRPRRPQVEQAEVVLFRAEAATRTDKELDREGSKAA
jgi:hypothetical protein